MSYCLILSGGSVKGFGLLGGIQAIFERYDSNEFTSFFGTSIGSIICYLLCIGYKPLEIIHNINCNKILHKVRTDIDILNALSEKGLVNFEYIIEELELMTLIKYDSLFTFKTLYEKLGKELCCITYNYTLQKKEILHYTTTPDLPCLLGLQMSSSLPFVFDKFEYNDNLYLDGGIADNFPISTAIEIFNKKNIIGLCIKPSIGDTSKDAMIHSFISNLLFIPIVEISRSILEKYKGHEGIINIYEILITHSFIDFNIDISIIMEMFSTGYNICSKI